MKYICPEIDIEKLYITDVTNDTETDDGEDNFEIVSGFVPDEA